MVPTPAQAQLNTRFEALNSRLSQLNLLILEHAAVRAFCLEAEVSEAWIRHIIPPHFLNNYSVIEGNERVFKDGVNIRKIAVLYANCKRRIIINELISVTKETTTTDTHIKALYAKHPDSHLRMLDNWVEEIKERLAGVSEEASGLQKVR